MGFWSKTAPEQHNYRGGICILHCFVRLGLFILSESQKNCLLGAPMQEEAAVKEFRIMLIVFSQRYGQVSLFRI